MKKLSAIASAVALSAAAFSAGAAPLTISNVQGSWFNPVPPGNADVISNQPGSGVDSVRWGVEPGNTGSGYDFDPTDPASPVVLNTPFLLGTFTHVNMPIDAGSQLTNISYALSFDTNGVPSGLSDTFNFAHNETPNQSPCAVSSVTPCADIVTVSSVSLNSLITVGADVYFFNLLGFSTNGGATISSQFISQENGSNSAGLYALVTTRPVPEPGSLALAGLALGGLAFGRRALAKKQA